MKKYLEPNIKLVVAEKAIMAAASAEDGDLPVGEVGSNDTYGGNGELAGASKVVFN